MKKRAGKKCQSFLPCSFLLRSVFNDDFPDQRFDLLFSVGEGGEVVDVHEGYLGSYVVAEAVEGFRIFICMDSIEGRGCIFQDGNGFLGGRGGENPVMVTQVDDISFLLMGSREAFSVFPELSCPDRVFPCNEGSRFNPAYYVLFILRVGWGAMGAGLGHHHFGWYAAVHGFGNT